GTNGVGFTGKLKIKSGGTLDVQSGSTTTFSGPVTFSGSGATAARRYDSTTCTDGNITIDATTADIFRAPATLTNNRNYTIKISSPTPPTGYTVHFFRTKVASAHTITLVEQTSARNLCTFAASNASHGTLVFDGTKWHLHDWGTFSSTEIGGTSDP